MRLALAQINSTVGDLAGNAARMLQLAHSIKSEQQADLLVFPEMALCGYPAGDLWLDPQFIEDCRVTLESIIQQLPDLGMILGYPRLVQNGEQQQANLAYKAAMETAAIYSQGARAQPSTKRDHTFFTRIATNHAGLYYRQKQLASYAKQNLPNYLVFDEIRYFVAGQRTTVFEWRGLRFGLLICEDLWQTQPIAACQAAGAQHILSINASPYHIGQPTTRHRLIGARARTAQLPISYANCWGGQDGIIFDGSSFVCDREGEIMVALPGMQEGVLIVDLDAHGNPVPARRPSKTTTETERVEPIDEIYTALKLGLHDYVSKNQFEKVVLGLSGGIDSALVLCLAVDAIGAKRVTALILPSQYTSAASLRDASALATKLGVHHEQFAITSVTDAIQQTMQTVLADESTSSVSMQNIQARARGLLLMAWANKHDALLLATGNKSEFAVGYATLYGDMAGGFCPLKDVLKTRVYALARHRNREEEIIPANIIKRAPSAELYAGQKDSDNLPDYQLLDAILAAYLEEGLPAMDIVKLGYDRQLVRQILRMVHQAEHKRHQAAVGTRISLRGFSTDRRYPITSGYAAQG